MLDSIDNKKLYLNISMLSPDRVLELSCGEVETAETLNYRNYHPSSNGLFSERIFGPVRDWECRCGKFKKIHYNGVVCDNCGVLVTSSRVRRERFGHIELGCNVVLPQYLYGGPSILSTVLDIPQSYLEKIVFQHLHINIYEFWSLDNKLKAIDDFSSDEKGECGTNGIFEVLKLINIREELDKIEERLCENSGYLTLGYLHRKEVLELFEVSECKPEWMIASRLLVMPAGLRPIVEHDGKNYASEINDRYRLIIQRAHLLGQLEDRLCPKVVVELQRRMIQIAVDSLFDAKLEKEDNDKVISDSLLKKVQNKVDHYVDYSASGQAVPDPNIDIERIGIPFDIATTMFKPFVANELIESGVCHNVKSAFRQIDNVSDSAKEALLELEDNFVVIVSSYPARLTSFKVSFVNDNYFRINSIVFEMLDLGRSDETSIIKVFAQLSNASAEESLKRIGVKSQIVSSYSEKIQLLPNQYARKWLTEMSKATEGKDRRFISKGEAFCAYSNRSVNVNELINIRCQTKYGFEYHEKTTLGRLIINEFMPQNMGIVNRSGLKSKYVIEHNYEIDEDRVISICEEIYRLFGADKYLEFLREFNASLCRYGTAVNVDMEPHEKVQLRRIDIKDYSKQINYIKKKVWGLRLGTGKGEKTSFRIDYKLNSLQEFCSDFLLNRRVAGDIYYYADKIVSDGDLITESLMQELRRRSIDSINIYTDSVNENGEYSKYAFGKTIEYNPYIVSLLSVENALYFLPRESADTFLSILLSNDFMLHNELIESILNEKEGEISHLTEKNDGKSNSLQYSKLSEEEFIIIKSYLIYSLLKSHDIKISVRQLCLLIEALITDNDHAVETELLYFNDDIGLNTLGENALRSPTIDLDCNYIRDSFGRINVYTSFEKSRTLEIDKDIDDLDDNDYWNDFDDDDMDEGDGF